MTTTPAHVRTSTSSGPSTPRALGGTSREWCQTATGTAMEGVPTDVLAPIDVSGSSANGFIVVVTVLPNSSGGGGGGSNGYSDFTSNSGGAPYTPGGSPPGTAEWVPVSGATFPNVGSFAFTGTPAAQAARGTFPATTNHQIIADLVVGGDCTIGFVWPDGTYHWVGRTSVNTESSFTPAGSSTSGSFSFITFDMPSGNVGGSVGGVTFPDTPTGLAGINPDAVLITVGGGVSGTGGISAIIYQSGSV